MKYHIVKEDDNLDSLAHHYGVSVDELVQINYNEVFGLGKKIKIPEKREKDITKNLELIYQKDKASVKGDEKYICPFCKNIILIPPKK